MDSFILSAMESEIVFVTLEAQERDRDAARAHGLVDAALDLEARHRLHPTRPYLKDGITLVRLE